VSTLFHGHPDLIVGFNTFLPPGYKIEVSDDHVGYIQVTHPSSRIESIAIGHPSSTYNLSITTPTSTTYHSSGIRQTSNLLNQDNDDNQLTNEISQQSINSTSQAVNALISAATAPQLPLFATTTGGNLTTKMTKQQPNNINSSGQPVEFNHAINYVNKIKNRFHQ
jgi:paired amphipathic helix protein Sin3a